ncbi:hypothetical protein PsorP6_007817 [Peronosclerospora sorghi]|uniref:Uncharacterized protein n=1 Tax=Peronosclerospora sorghi TaxID=230839 RepID=A0ACC0WAL4_9STRA|nr:hypothetical protein PsorP6_007817 [Peronosclerospora sorghi]
MLKPHVLVAIACFLAAASARAAIPITEVAALHVDSSNRRVDHSDQRNLRAKVPDGSEEERGLTKAQLEHLVGAITSKGRKNCRDQLDLHVLSPFGLQLDDVKKSFKEISAIVPYNIKEPNNRAWMALGDAYFKKQSDVNFLTHEHAQLQAHARREKELVVLLKRKHINPERGVAKFRILCTKNNDARIPIEFVKLMALGSEIAEKARLKENAPEALLMPQFPRT